MQALMSKLAREFLRQGISLTMTKEVTLNGVKYVIKYVPKAN